jgi:hypothetical protein
MKELRELAEPGRRKVKEVIEESGRVTEIDQSFIQEHSFSIEGETADLEGLETELEGIREDHEPYDHNIDAAAAPHIREYIDVSRRVAANEGLWHWLCVSEFPEFVYHRWERYSDIEGKFLEGGTNIYSNALHRLWWGAELTRDGNDYDRTKRLFEQGELANDVLDRWFARHQPAATEVVDALSGEDSGTISDVTRDIRNELSVYTLELMSGEEFSEFVNRTMRER